VSITGGVAKNQILISVPVDKRHVAGDRAYPVLKVLFCITGPVLIVLAGIVQSPGPPPERSVDIRVANAHPARDGWVVTVTLSNASQCPVLYLNGPLVAIAALSNGVWETNWGNRGVTGAELLAPGASCMPFDVSEHIPAHASAVKIGLEFISCSWRSRLAWHLPRSGVFDPIARWLAWPDCRRRSRTEWSQTLELVSSNGIPPRSR
jgi:hypothetical protein